MATTMWWSMRRTIQGMPQDTVSIHVKKSSVSKVSISPSGLSAVQGRIQTFKATAEGQNSPDQSVIWTISGNSSANTKIDTKGNLTIAADEKPQQSLTVTATSVADSSKSGTATVTVIAPVVTTENTDVVYDLTEAILPEGVTEVIVGTTEVSKNDYKRQYE